MKRLVGVSCIVFFALISVSGVGDNRHVPSWSELEKKYYIKTGYGNLDYDEIKSDIYEAIVNADDVNHPIWTKMRLQFIKMLMDEYKKQETLSKDIRIRR